MMAVWGLAMFALLALGIARSGLPVWALLMGVSSLFAALGLLLGVFDTSILTLLPARTLGLLEHDLLQALPLYVLIGVLLQRLPLAQALLDCTVYGLQRIGLPTPSALLVIGAVFTPMNGSVASSGLMLKSLLPAQQQPRHVAIRAAAATLGVAIPPSLVLLLLGDTMMRAHLEANKINGVSAQIINTQALLTAALLPAVAVLLARLALSMGLNRGTIAAVVARPSRRQIGLALATVGGIAALLLGIFQGYFFAVEAAATGCCLLLLGALLARALKPDAWLDVAVDTAALSGALFAILLGASTFSLVLRAWGTDAWVAQTLLTLQAAPLLKALILLAVIALAAWVLDAFEMIVVVVPIIAPLLIASLGDAQQAAVLVLLVLQMSFLLPPLGYAVVMLKPAAMGYSALLKALAPYLVVLACMFVAVCTVPSTVHWLDKTTPNNAAATLSEDDIANAMNAVGEQAEAAAPR
jgi:TRAP-type mannitol/chloroaromatic compound transport system permease large subunit